MHNRRNLLQMQTRSFCSRFLSSSFSFPLHHPRVSYTQELVYIDVSIMARDVFPCQVFLLCKFIFKCKYI
jgi:hypothetical protein